MRPNKLKEDRIHGDPLYPVSIYDISCRAGETLLDLHWHDELELLTVTEGRGMFRVDVHDYELREGEAIFVGAGELHSGYLPGNEGCSFTAVVFHPDILGGKPYDLVQEAYIQPFLHKKFAAPSHIAKDSLQGKEIMQYLDQIIALNRSQAPYCELTTKALLLLIVSRLLVLGAPAGEKKPTVDRTRIERLKTVLEYIQANISRPIRLEELAGLASLSEAHFCRFFKEITTKSPVDYMNRLRMQHAAGLLKETDKKMIEIALDVGFHNVSYFIETFKRYFGCTPSAYRKRS